MKSIKQFSVCVLVAALAVSPLAQARIGGGSHSSSSHSYSSSSSSSGYSSGSSTRVGSGSSVGMSRSDVMGNVRQGQSGSSSSYAPPAQPVLPQRSGPGWGTVAGAAAAAGAVGYMMGDHQGNNGNGAYNNGGYNGGGANNGATGSYGNGSPGVAPVNNGGGGFGFGSFLFLLLVVGAIVFMVRRYRAQNIQPVFAGAPQAQGFGGSNSSLSWQAEGIFRDLQELNNGSNPDQLREFCTPELFEQLQGNVGGSTRVVSLRSEVVDDSGNVASVRFRGAVSENGGPTENLDEVWHFVRNAKPGGREWLLAGIEQV